MLSFSIEAHRHGQYDMTPLGQMNILPFWFLQILKLDSRQPGMRIKAIIPLAEWLFKCRFWKTYNRCEESEPVSKWATISLRL
jgi:hypothetical protein